MSKKLINPYWVSMLLLIGVACNISSATPTIPTALLPTQALPSVVAATPTVVLNTTIPPTLAIPTVVSSTPTNTAVPPTTVPPTEMPPTPTQTLVGSPIPHFLSGQSIAITNIHMIDATVGWATGGLVGVGDHILITADGGLTWKDVTPPEPAPAGNDRKSAIGFFQSPKIAWVSYDNLDYLVPARAVVWHTEDGGQSWQASQPLDVNGLSETWAISDLQFADSQTGWLLTHVGAGMNHDYVALYRTGDGGTTWTRLIDPYNDGGIQSCQKTGMLFTDPQYGWLTGDCNGVAPGVLLFRSADGGSSWESVTLPAPVSAPGIFESQDVACGSYFPTFFNAQAGKLAVQCVHFAQNSLQTDHFLFNTNDGGKTWSEGTYPGGSLTFMTSNIGWAFDKVIYKTQDGGKTWTKVSQVTWTGQFSFVNEQLGWAVARSGGQIALVDTTNGGEKWAELAPTIGP